MPGTTRYSATFDRTYEEDDRVNPQPPPNARRSRSQSWQANSGLDGGRPYTPLGIRPPNQRSSSTDNGPTNQIPTRTLAKTVVKPHTNPFQFVKVGTCPLYKKAEEQLKKVKEVKQPEVLKEEEEEWQTNLDSWKSRRRKMSEDVFRRQEEIKQFELEEQVAQVAQKKTKTFSEMVESRQHRFGARGRALSLCLISSPMDLQNWEFQTNSHKTGSCSTFSGESEENSTVNSEDEGVSLKGMLEKSPNDTHNNHRTNGNSHIENNASDSHNGEYSKLSDLSTNSLQIKPKEGSYIDSGLESISSHRAGDTPDSGSDFSHDSGSSIDCESPRTGVNILEEFSPKSSQMPSGHEVSVQLRLNEKGQDFGFTFLGGKDEGKVIITSVLEGSKADSSSLQLGDQIISINGEEVCSKKHVEIDSMIQKGRGKGEITLQLWRHTKCTDNHTSNGFITNGKQTNDTSKNPSPLSKTNSQQYEKSIESENEMYVDDFEELQRQSELVTPSSKSETFSEVNGQKSPSTKDVIASVTLSEAKPPRTPLSKSNVANSSVVEQQKNTQNGVSEVNKNSDIKTKTRRKGVYGLNVSTPTTNSKEAFSVNSLFPLSPVSELPSPDDVKSIAATLSSNVTSDTNTISKELTNGSSVAVSSNLKEKVKPLTNGTGTVSPKIVPADDLKILSSKTVTKVDSVVPSSPVLSKNLKLTDSPVTPQEQKPKLILRKVKTKSKKDTELTTPVVENGTSCTVTSEVLENSSTDKLKSAIPSSPTISDNKDKSITESQQDPKPKLVLKRVKTKPMKANAAENTASAPPEVINKGSTAIATSSDLPKKIENNVTKETKTDSLEKKIAIVGESKNNKSSDNQSVSVESKAVTETPTAENIPPSTTRATVSNLSRTPSVKATSKNESSDMSLSNDMKPKIPTITQEETAKPSFVQRRTASKPKENGKLTLKIKTVTDDTEKAKSPKTPITPKTASPKSSDKKDELVKDLPEVDTPKTEALKTSPNVQDNDPKSARTKKIRTRKKNANSQKVNNSAKQIEESTTPNSDSLNVVFQSQPKSLNSENQSNSVKNSDISSNNKAYVDLVSDIPPVEKVAEEMENLILAQLEEEERAKELASGLLTKSPFGSPDHLLTAPPKLAEPPKEKPPPPPSASEGNTKDTSLKRVNSTKRIKKEIHKRRSNFLGIDNADENVGNNESSIPPPPALEEILKAEMELDRQGRLQIESASTERLTLEEKEIMQKEREIIETLESEERRKQLMNGTGDFYDIMPSNENDVVVEEHIEFLKSEQKRLELERISEEQQLRILEETQLRELKEREEFIRKQEADKSSVPLSDSSSLSVVPKERNTLLPSLSADTQSKVSNSDAIGDGKSLTANSELDLSKVKPSESAEKVTQKPAVPPKPLKKKEAIRKERERLRQEQEALQREREEHRRKLMQEQEELLKQQKAHAPDAPVPRLGPLPPLVQPSFSPPLTTIPHARDSASYPSRSHHGASNGPVESINTAELMGPAVVRQNKMPPARKPVQSEAWGQQKVTSVRKQNQDSLTDNRYNQNHWLIQEAEMRRIAELKDRQRKSQLSRSQTNLAEDNVCSNGPRVPVVLPIHNQQLNYAVQDKMWNYNNQPSVVPIKKYPPPVVKEQLHTIYPRETVSQQPPMKPSRVVPMERQEQMLSVSGRKRCSHCNEELGRGAAMIIESLQLYYHIQCFQCCVCQAQLGNGSCGADVRVRNQKLHCHNCYSNDEAGLKFSQV